MKRIEKDKIKEVLREFKNNHFEQFFASILIFLIALIGLFNFFEYGWYFFSFCFFLAGYYCGLKVKGIGVVFLFTHGLIGIGAMIYILIGSVFENPTMQDNATNVYIYIGIAVIFILISFFEVVIYNLSDKLNEKKFMLYIPLITILIALIMMGILPQIFDKIYSLNLLK